MIEEQPTMDEDDDMFMIIIGDDAEEPFPIPIKAEVIDESEIDLQSLLDNAKTNGQYLREFNDLLKEGKYSNEPGSEKVDEVYLSDSDESDKQFNKCKPKKNYVAQLKKNFPKMRNNEECLVAHLTEMMKNTKPPTPPIGFCTNVNNQLTCSYCFVVSASLPGAARHYQKKHGTRYLVCYACGADFKCTTGLYKHEKRCVSPHARIVLMARGRYLGRKGRKRPYQTLEKFSPWPEKKKLQCSSCPASFSQKDALEAHQNMHSGLRPYQCDQCPVAYTNSQALKRHFDSNHSDARFICDTCKRSFKTRTAIISHMNTHLPVPKYGCSECPRRFSQKMALTCHVDRDHLKRPPPFACTECPRRFPRLFILKGHLKKRHGLTLLTRQMFMKALPSMKDEELKQATIVFNNVGNTGVLRKTHEVGNIIKTKSPKSQTKTKYNQQKRMKKRVEQTGESGHVCLDITYTTDDFTMSIKTDDVEDTLDDPYLETLEYGQTSDTEDLLEQTEAIREPVRAKIQPANLNLLRNASSKREENKINHQEVLERKNYTSKGPSPHATSGDKGILANMVTERIKLSKLESPVLHRTIVARNEPKHPSETVVRKLQENCEIEFARIGAGESPKNNAKAIMKCMQKLRENHEQEAQTEVKDAAKVIANTKITPKVNTGSETIAHTGTIKTIPLSNSENKDTMTKISTDISNDCKIKGTPKITYARKPIETRSNVRKTRSGMKISAKGNGMNTRSKN